VLTLLASAIAHAQTATGATELQKVEITGTADRNYAPAEASSATRTSTPLKETPVTVQVVDESLIRDKAVRNPNALADVVAGVQPVVGYGSTTSQYLNIRGFSNVGVNYRNGYRSAEVYTPRDLANVERVEFVKGPASVLYGAAQPGGAVNTVTKQPLDRNFTRADFSWDRFDTGRLTVDANRTFGEVGLRLNAAAESGGTWIDLEKNRNALLAPVVRWRIAPETSLLYEGEFQRTERRGWSNGLLAVPGLQDLPFGTTVSEPWTYLDNTNVSHRVEFNTALGAGWSFRQGLMHSYAKRSHVSVSPAFSADPLADGWSLTNHGRVKYAQVSDNPTNTVAQSEVNGMLSAAGIEHRLLAGLEASRSVFEYTGIYDSLDAVDLTTFRPGSTPAYTPVDPSGSRRTARSTALYVQDQVALGDWRLLAGMRHERVTSATRDLPSGGADEQTESATTARLGALYLLTPGTAAYYSFSQSFSPNLGGRSASSGGGLFPAERGVQHEVGLKHTLAPGLEATAALFEITKRNVLVGDPNDPTKSITNGEQRSRGLEASLSGRVARNLKLIANLTALDAEVTKDTDPAQVGQKLTGVARRSANAWGLWALPGNVEAGLGIVHVGEREAAQPNLDYFKLPAYTRFDASLAWKSAGWRLALNVDNLGNRKIINTVEGYAVFIESPRRWTLSAGVEF
jgi:iron complex outermembrane receptor protein